MSLSIRSRIILIFVLSVGGGFWFLIDWIAEDMRPRYLESLEESLVDTANILAGLVETSEQQHLALQDGLSEAASRQLNAQIYALKKSDVSLRVYITDAAGIVLFDSQERGLGEDYSRWNDVYLTLRGQYGARSSKERKGSEATTLYVAAPLYRNGTISGVLSVGKPTRNIELFIAQAERKFWAAGALAALSVIFLSAVLSLWVSRPLMALRGYAQQIQRGERAVLPDLGNNELGDTGRALEEMRHTLDGKEYVERYVQSLTHELKSPLASIRGAAELLGEALPPERQQAFASNILHETSRLDDLVERLLKLAELEQQQQPNDVEVVPVTELVDDVISSLSGLAEKRQVSLINQSEQETITGEQFLLRLAVLNLCKNALEFSPAGGQVTISSGEDNCIVVSDSGPGVPSFATERLFERFYSLPRPDSGRKSTGLGLSFVDEIAKLHGGEISFRNTDSGAEFRFTVGK